MIGEEAYLRKGYGKRVINLLMEHIHANTQAKEIIVKPDEDNPASYKALTSCGFQYDKAAAYYKRGFEKDYI